MEKNNILKSSNCGFLKWQEGERRPALNLFMRKDTTERAGPLHSLVAGISACHHRPVLTPSPGPSVCVSPRACEWRAISPEALCDSVTW